MRRSRNSLVALFLVATPVARAAPQTREPLTIREPSLKGGTPTLVTADLASQVRKASEYGKEYSRTEASGRPV